MSQALREERVITVKRLVASFHRLDLGSRRQLARIVASDGVTIDLEADLVEDSLTR
ncbi:hypothetical protein [Synechococcus sp. WH 8020]|uniref:hypothetical protein n=1 Tax=Synechococcus sp. (strain WH8020) TaxID=32052 RepID=UPI001FE179D4|nr:hypothetical protein [Synechococcus sp. WH 8020]